MPTHIHMHASSCRDTDVCVAIEVTIFLLHVTTAATCCLASIVEGKQSVETTSNVCYSKFVVREWRA